MSERNLLNNGRFLQSLTSWTASGAVYSAGDGDDHYGVASLPVGAYIEQSFSVQRVRLYTLHISVKPVGAILAAGNCTLSIKDSTGNTLFSKDLTGAIKDVWEENILEIGIATGTTYTLRITNVNFAGGVSIDDVWLWNVPLSRLAIATRLHSKLGRLATDRALSITPAGVLTEGSYTYGIDAGLRSVGAINPETGLPDVRYLSQDSIQTAIDFIEREVIEQLQRDYAVEVDISVGQRRESLSQISKALGDITGTGGQRGGGTSARIVMRKLGHGDFDG